MTAYEKSSCVGGLWKMGKDGKVWDNLRTNLSKYSCSFSDFPPQSKEDFPTAEDMRKYLASYCKAFGLENYIQFNSEVLNVEKMEGKWKVEVKGKPSRIFDFVCVSSGFFSRPHIPSTFKDTLDRFKGRTFHSSEYKNPSIFRGKRVLVVGGAFSGSEIAADIVREADRTTLVARRPMYYIPRIIDRIPVDLVFYKFGKKKSIDLEAKHRYLASVMRDSISSTHVGRVRFPICNKSNPTYVAIASNFLQHLDRIKICKDSISCFEKNGVIFSSSSSSSPSKCVFEAFDDIVFATGYRISLSFLSKKTLRILNFRDSDMFKPLILHECVWHPNLPGLAFCGMYRGPYFAIMELQSRWIMGVFSGRMNLPSMKEMSKGLDRERAIRDLKPRPQFPHSDYVEMAKRLAEYVGVMPCTEDRKGSLLPFHFRLRGFGSNEKVARSAIGAASAAYQ